MFYHQRSIKYVRYGKVHPPEIEGDDFSIAYQWLGQYCCFVPQIWLSRSMRGITGFNSRPDLDLVLFGFRDVHGFDVDYKLWCELLNLFLNISSVEDVNEALQSEFEERASLFESNGDSDMVHEVWQKTRSVDKILRKCLFAESDQVVVPALNLAVAKVIFCRTDSHKKMLRKMGFFEGRIKVLPRKPQHHQ